MKNWKIYLIATLAFFSSAARADMSYQWVKMNAEQAKAFHSNCNTLDGIRTLRDGVFTAGAGFVAYMAVMATQNGTSVPGVLVGAAGAASATVATRDMIQFLMTGDEIKSLVNEQESGRPGLVTSELEQIASENQLDANAMLAVLNLRAIDKALCWDQTLGPKLFQNLDQEQSLAQRQREALTKQATLQIQQILYQVKN